MKIATASCLVLLRSKGRRVALASVGPVCIVQPSSSDLCMRGGRCEFEPVGCSCQASRTEGTVIELADEPRPSYIGAMTYVALLRGINVGGRGMIDMKELAAVFETVGMTSARTYINSGNVVFVTDLPDQVKIGKVLEDAIEERFGFSVRVLVRNVDEIRSVVEALPADWTNDQSMKCDVFFLWDELDGPSILERLEFDPEMEDVRYTPGAVIRRVDRKNASRSKLTKIVGTPLYQQMTIRNCNTARKLLELMRG